MVIKDEKRRAPRVPVSMRIGSAEGEAIGFGYALNISEQGLAVDAQALANEKVVPLVGTKIRMQFKLPKSDLVITVYGKVVRVERNDTSPRLALEFLDATPEIRTEIARYVSTRATTGLRT
ncbi:MAG: PilZ domain-containing protein [Pseudomonadota bacterium]